MGDHRATVKIEFTFHDKTHKMDSWINWWPDSECEGVDQRVIDFFRDATKEGMEKYRSDAEAIYQREHAADIERAERAELARLQAKYT